MRGLCVVTLAAVVLSVLAVGPDAHAVELGVGIQAGFNLSRAPYDYTDDIDVDSIDHTYRSGVSGGVVVLLRPAREGRFWLESGLSYEMRGGTTEVDFTITEPMHEEYAWELEYLTIPILAGASFGSGGTTPYLKGGLEVGILLSARYEGPEYIQQPAGQDIDKDVADWFTTLDVGLSLAAGVEFPVRTLTSYAEIGYVHGLLDVLDPDDADIDITVRNRVLALRAGLRF